MLIPLFASLLLLGDVSDSKEAQLRAAAAATGRPVECISATRRGLAKGPSVWQQARVPSLMPYCDLIARAHAQLSSDPAAASKSAERADQLLPGRASPTVILARAALITGDAKKAASLFGEARTRDPRSLEEPQTMHDLARALARTDRLDQALATYRALVPRTALLSNRSQRAEVLLEAAHLSMTISASKPTGDRSATLDEPLAFLQEARRMSAHRLTGDVLLSLALTLDRAGRSQQADALVQEAARTSAKLAPVIPNVVALSPAPTEASDDKDPKPPKAPEPKAPTQSDPSTAVPIYLASSSDAHALRALMFEVSDPSRARVEWDAYLSSEAGSGPFADAARARRARLSAPKKTSRGR